MNLIREKQYYVMSYPIQESKRSRLFIMRLQIMNRIDNDFPLELGQQESGGKSNHPEKTAQRHNEATVYQLGNQTVLEVPSGRFVSRFYPMEVNSVARSALGY